MLVSGNNGHYLVKIMHQANVSLEVRPGEKSKTGKQVCHQFCNDDSPSPLQNYMLLLHFKFIFNDF